MEGLIAVLGFWICVIAVIMKKPIMAYLEKSKQAPTPDVSAINQRVQQLEGLVSTLNNQLSELNANAEYSHKLLVLSAQKLADAEQLLIETSSQTSLLIQETQQQRGPIMIEAAPASSSFGKILNDNTICFERSLPGSIDEVRQYLSTPGGLSKWLASASIEARLGGRLELNFAESEMPSRKNGSRIIGLINSFDPQRKIAFSYMDTSNDLDSAVTIELSEQGDGHTSVVLTHSRLPKSKMHEFMAGWHAHLDVLAARLANIVPPDFSRRFSQVLQKYAAMVAATIVVSGTAAAAMQVPAEAASNLDQGSYQTVKVERSDLLRRYDLLWRDVDEHQRKMDQLKRENSIDSQRQVDQLDRQLEDEYGDLHQLEVQIKELDKVLN